MTPRLLLCTDLDRTLLPNGHVPESAGAREHFAALAARPDVHLAYVSGRHLALVKQAMGEYHLPQPDYILSDVGTCLYRYANGRWQLDAAWQSRIDQDFAGLDRDTIQASLPLPGDVWLQEAEKQNRHKLSYYLDPVVDTERLGKQLRITLAALGVKASLVFSVDDLRGIGLLDILPASASKLGAVEFLIAAEGITRESCVFAGDSGNDLEVLASGLNAVLVANATEAVRSEALRLAEAAGTQNSLYLARGGWRGSNGNYSSGILEGIFHFHPELEAGV